MAHVTNVHSREIAAPAVVVGELLDSLGTPHDRLWPTDLWPTTPFEMDRPLEVGATGGHGSVRYGIEQYEPGKRLLFRFTPGEGLEGVHGLTIEPLETGGTRLTHFLEVDTTGWMRPLTPVLLAWHDTMVETILDRAQSEAEGDWVEPTRWPLWLRAANGAEVALSRWRPGHRLFRTAAVLVPSVLLGIAVLHGVWAAGSSWPARDFDALAESVISSAEMPPNWATWTVAGMLTGAAGAVAAVGAGRRERPLRAATWTTAGVLTARGALFPPVDLAGGLNTEVQRLDLLVYSPLCLALGLGAAIVARGPARRRPLGSRHLTKRPARAS